MRKFLTILILVMLPLAVFSLSSAFAQATVNINPQSGLPIIAPGGETQAQNVISFIINAIVFIGVLAALIYLIYGGIKWITSGGDKTAVDTARQHIIGAIIGLVVIVLSYVIINFVLFFLTGNGLGPTLPLPGPIGSPASLPAVGVTASQCIAPAVINGSQCCLIPPTVPNSICVPIR